MIEAKLKLGERRLLGRRPECSQVEIEIEQIETLVAAARSTHSPAPEPFLPDWKRCSSFYKCSWKRPLFPTQDGHGKTPIDLLFRPKHLTLRARLGKVPALMTRSREALPRPRQDHQPK